MSVYVLNNAYTKPTNNFIMQNRLFNKAVHCFVITALYTLIINNSVLQYNITNINLTIEFPVTPAININNKIITSMTV